MLQESYADSCSVCVGWIDDNTSLVEVTGEIDVATVSLLAKALGNAIDSGMNYIVLDTQNLTYIDSAGLQTLISTQMKLESGGREMVIVGCHGIFQRLMQISRIDRRFRMFASVDEAMTGFKQPEAT